MRDTYQARAPRHSRRRVLIRGLVLPAAAAVLAACGAAPTPTVPPPKPIEAPKPAAAAPTTAPAPAGKPSEPPKPAEPTKPDAAAKPAAAAPAAKKVAGEVEFWSRETGAQRQDLVKKHLEAFDRTTGAKSKVQFMVFQESFQKTQAALAAGTVPEVGQQGQDLTTSFAAAGHLLPIDEAHRDLGPQNFVPLQKDGYVNWKGKLYGVPWYIETRILFYHKDLLEKAGVKPPKLWSEWVEGAKKLTQGEQFGFIHSMEGAGAGHFWINLAQSNGGLFLDKDGQVVADSPAVVEGLQFAADFYLKHKVMPEATPTYKGTDVSQLFHLKKLAMLYANGQVIDDTVKQRPDALPNLGGVLIPVNKPDHVTRSFLGGFQLFTMKAAKNPEGGLELLKWMYQEPWYAEYVKLANGALLPVTKAAASTDFFQKDELRRLLVTQQETALRYGGPAYGNAPFLGEAEGKLLFSQALTDVVAGKKSAAEAVKTLDTELKEIAKTAPT